MSSEHFPQRARAQLALDAFRAILATAKGRFRSRVSPVWTHYEDSVFLSVVGHAIDEAITQKSDG